MRSASLIAALSLAVAASARAFTITPNFIDGDTQTWNATEEAVVNEAISDWTSQLTFVASNQNIVMNFDFTHAGTSSYLAQWNGNSSAVPFGTSLSPWSPSINDTININADLMVPRDPSTGAGANVTLLFTQGTITSANWDGLSAVRHELGHALGFTTLYSDGVGTLNTDKYSDHISGFGNSTFFDNTEGGLDVQVDTSSDIVHLANTNDLMGTTLLNGVRKNISITDLQMLSLAYGYQLTVPAGTSYTTAAINNANLTVNGSLKLTNTGADRQSDSVLLNTGSLSIGSGGLFNLNNHDIIIHAGLALSDIKNLINSGRNTGNWDGTTGITSSAAAADHTTALGYARAGDLNMTSFDGVAVSPSDLIIKYTYYGDANLDGIINLLDIQAVANHWQSHTATWSTGDFNGDGTVDLLDLQYVANNWQAGTGSSTQLLMPAFDSLLGAPEPASLLTCASLVPALLLTRRPHRR